MDTNYALNSMKGFLDDSGQYFKADQIDQYIREGIIPVQCSMLVGSFDDTKYVSLNQVRQLNIITIKRNMTLAVFFWSYWCYFRYICDFVGNIWSFYRC